MLVPCGENAKVTLGTVSKVIGDSLITILEKRFGF